MHLFWLLSARNDLVEARRYITENNPAAAGEVAARIRGSARTLSTNPYIGRVGRIIDTRELVVKGTPYIIVYTIDGEQVLVLAVIHSRRRWY